MSKQTVADAKNKRALVELAKRNRTIHSPPPLIRTLLSNGKIAKKLPAQPKWVWTGHGWSTAP